MQVASSQSVDSSFERSASAASKNYTAPVDRTGGEQELTPLVGWAPCLQQLQDLKRIRTVDSGSESLATRLYRASWSALLEGQTASQLAPTITALALIMLRFPGFKLDSFRRLGLGDEELKQLLQAAVRDYLPAGVPAHLRRDLIHAVNGLFDREGERLGNVVCAESAPLALPEPLERLIAQPRAGATHPVKARLLLLPPESHAEHVLLTAVYATMLAESYSASLEEVFLGALAHHLHNAYLPDMGFAGELALGERLGEVLHNAREQALDHFEPSFANSCRRAVAAHDTLTSPAGRTLVSADVLDRVLDLRYRVRSAQVTEREVLGEHELIHPGPLRDFQTRLLEGLAL